MYKYIIVSFNIIHIIIMLGSATSQRRGNMYFYVYIYCISDICIFIIYLSYHLNIIAKGKTASNRQGEAKARRGGRKVGCHVACIGIEGPTRGLLMLCYFIADCFVVVL